MRILRIMRYLPLIMVLLAAAGAVLLGMGGGKSYSDSTFVFSNQG